MGQSSSSSQPNPLNMPKTTEERDVSATTMKHERRRKKARKENGTKALENDIQEEESSRTLLQLRGDTVYPDSPPSHDDNLAASAQLHAESSPSQPQHFKNVEININGRAGRANEQKKHKKSKRNHREQEELRSSQLGEESPSEELPVNSTTNPRHTTTLADRSNPPPSTFSLDDIHTEDEAIASYLREYENDEELVMPPLSPYSEAGMTDSRMLQQLAPFTSQRVDFPIDFELKKQLHSGSYLNQHNKRKRRAEGSVVLNQNDDDSISHVSSSGSGQHTFDHEVFDNLINDFLANSSGQVSDGNIPIDPDLIQNGISPITEDTMADSGDEFEDSNSKGKPSSDISSRKRKRMEEKLDIEDYNLPNVGSPESDENLQNRVLSGIEDVGSRSPTNNFPRASTGQSDPRSSSEVMVQTEEIPPPLRKSCKPRGNKTQQGGRRSKKYNPPLTQIAQKGGMFTTSEIAKTEAFRDAYCQEHEITARQFNELVHAPVRGNIRAKALWEEIYELYPYRTKMSASRFCRRHFHNFAARGTWTPSEDERLKLAVAEKGKSWKAVGEMIDRFAEDCRDRYRNYHINATNRNREHWTEAEVKNLCWAVYDCMKEMKAERRKAREEKFDGRDVPDSEPESDQEVSELKLINWQAVSDRMGSAGGGRSRLQCSFKWGKLKTAERDRYWKDLKAVVNGKSRSDKRKSTQQDKHWRLRRARKKLDNMKIGDRYDFLQALATCGAVDIGNIPWRLLGDEEFRAKWRTIDRKAAWENFKAEVPGSAGMDYRDVINRLLTKLLAEHSDQLDERWNPQEDGDVNVARRADRKERRRQQRQPMDKDVKQRKLDAANPKIKSNIYVHPSDENDSDYPLQPSQNITHPTTHHAASATDTDQEARSEARDANAAESDEESNNDSLFFTDGNISSDLASQLQLPRE